MLSILAEPVSLPSRNEFSVPSREEERVMQFLKTDIEFEERTETTEPGEGASAEESEEFEIVMGRRQVASVLFLATVIVAVFSSVSYLAGKSIGPKKTESMAAIAAASTAASTVEKIPTIDASIMASKPAPADALSDAPLFGEPVVGAVYIQMAAVEKGIAAVFAEGLRRHGMQSFVAPGPSENMYRVLIGPLPTPASYAAAKTELDRIGITTFARKYEK
jgi:cell division septation protein DedD